MSADTILHNAKIATNDVPSFVEAVAITSAIDAGGGFQNYPEDYGVVNELHQRGELSVRLAYNLFTQKPSQELADFQRLSSYSSWGSALRCTGLRRSCLGSSRPWWVRGSRCPAPPPEAA